MSEQDPAKYSRIRKHLNQYYAFDPVNKVWYRKTPTGKLSKKSLGSPEEILITTANLFPAIDVLNCIQEMEVAIATEFEQQQNQIKAAKEESKDQLADFPFLEGKLYTKTHELIMDVLEHRRDDILPSGVTINDLSVSTIYEAIRLYDTFVVPFLEIEKPPRLAEGSSVINYFKVGVNTIAREKMVAVLESLSYQAATPWHLDQSQYLFNRLTQLLLPPGTEPTSLKYRATFYMLQHMIWQVKRKLVGLPVDRHIFLNFYGPKGIGKTELLRRIFRAPIPDLADVFRLSDLMGNFTSQLKTRYYLAIIEELEGMDRTDQKAFKALVTADTGVEREIFSSTPTRYRQNLTFIGSSNLPLSDLIPDTTGHLRRYWEINLYERCPKVHDTLDWGAVNEIGEQSTIMWQGVDEQSDSPLVQHWKELKDYIYEKQESWRRKTVTELFMVDKGYYVPGQDVRSEDFAENGEWRSVRSIFKSKYKPWLEEYMPGNKANYKQFTRELEAIHDVPLRGSEKDREVFIITGELDDAAASLMEIQPA